MILQLKNNLCLIRISTVKKERSEAMEHPRLQDEDSGHDIKASLLI